MFYQGLSQSMYNVVGLSSSMGVMLRQGRLSNIQSVDEKSINSLDNESVSETNVYEDSKYFKQYKTDVFPWEPQRFVNHPWSNKKRIHVRTRHLHELQLDEDEINGILSKRVISCCLIHLERSPYDLKYALCKCLLESKNLVDISAIRSYHYIQYLNLSSNKLTTLEALSEMPYLQYLNASNNHLEELLDFTAPLFLSFVDYSHNKIKKIPDLSRFWSIYHLNLSNNDIKDISKGLLSLRYLIYLNLSHNDISCIKNLNNLRLETLIMSNNKICVCEIDQPITILGSLDFLKEVDFSFNKISTLKFLERCWNLETITMTDNFIKELVDIYYLRDHLKLKILNLCGNEISKIPHFGKTCVRLIKRLIHLNCEDITVELKIEACTKANISPELPASLNRLQLLLLESMNISNTGNNPYKINKSRTKVLMIVGPPASNKKHFARQLVNYSKDHLVLGVIHTTRPKRSIDIDGKDHYFIEHDAFLDLVKKGEFVTMSEFNGHLYGISHSEFHKAGKSITVFCCDIKTALITKMTGVQLTMVLALPRDKQLHLDWIKSNYFFEEELCATLSDVHIMNCPLIISSLLRKDSQINCDNIDLSISSELDLLSGLIYTNQYEQSSLPCSYSSENKTQSVSSLESSSSHLKEKSSESDDTRKVSLKKEGKYIRRYSPRRSVTYDDHDEVHNIDIDNNKIAITNLNSNQKVFNHGNNNTQTEKNVNNNVNAPLDITTKEQIKKDCRYFFSTLQDESSIISNKDPRLHGKQENLEVLNRYSHEGTKYDTHEMYKSIDNIKNTESANLKQQELYNNNGSTESSNKHTTRSKENIHFDDEAYMLAKIPNKKCVCTQTNRTGSEICTCSMNMLDVNHIKIVKEIITEIIESVEKNVLCRELASQSIEEKQLFYNEYTKDKGVSTYFIQNKEKGKGISGGFEKHQIIEPNIKSNLYSSTRAKSNKNYSFTPQSVEYINNKQDIRQKKTRSKHTSRATEENDIDSASDSFDNTLLPVSEPRRISVAIDVEPTIRHIYTKDDLKPLEYARSISNWSLDNDGDSCSHMAYFPRNEARLSISNNEMVKLMAMHFRNAPLLSVLSGEFSKEKVITKYNTLSDRIDQALTDKLQPFLESIMKTREELLELHWENPGMFYSLIFTDDEHNSFHILKTAIKNMINNDGDLSDDDYENSLQEDISFNEIVKKRLKTLETEFFRCDSLIQNTS